MQIHSLKLTFQDIVTKDAAKLAVVLGTLFIDNEEKVLNEKTGEFEPALESIQFTTALSTNPELEKVIQGIMMEALTLKNIKIAKENGTLTHFLETCGAEIKSKPLKRVSKTRSKAKKK